MDPTLKARISRVRPGVDDVLIVAYDRKLSQQEAAEVRETFTAALPDTRIIILDDGATIDQTLDLPDYLFWGGMFAMLIGLSFAISWGWALTIVGGIVAAVSVGGTIFTSWPGKPDA